MSKARLVVGVAATTMLAACASTGVAPTTASRPPAGDRYLNAELLTRSDFASLVGTDLLEAIRMIRPAFLRSRGSEVSVALDGVLVGDVSTLRTIPSNAVMTVRLLHGPEATMRFGIRHAGSVLLVTTRAR
jgi:hypothetical protein